MVWHNDQVSELETEKIMEIARECLTLPGDFVEMGCYKGDTSLMLAEVLREYRESTSEKAVENHVKKLWIYDSFEGLPKKKVEDESILGTSFKEGELVVSKREVKERFLRAGLPLPMIKKAWFNELKSEDLPEKIALAFLDGDFYDSIKDSLQLVGSRMVEGGIIIVHDYNNPVLPGVKKAVDEWITKEKTVTIYQSMAII